jgi:hypothetical protein
MKAKLIWASNELYSITKVPEDFGGYLSNWNFLGAVIFYVFCDQLGGYNYA